MLLSLIQVNESALSCFPDLRRQMFRRGLISNVIWNVISNCLSQMISRVDLRLSLFLAELKTFIASVCIFVRRHATKNKTFDLGFKSPCDACLGLQMAQKQHRVGLLKCKLFVPFELGQSMRRLLYFRKGILHGW